MSPAHYNPVGFFFLAIMSKSPVHDNPKGSHIEMPNSPEGYNPVGS